MRRESSTGDKQRPAQNESAFLRLNRRWRNALNLFLLGTAGILLVSKGTEILSLIKALIHSIGGLTPHGY